MDAGFADPAAVTRVLREGLRARGVTVVENTEPQAITRTGRTWTVLTEPGPVESDVLVITAGLGTNDVLGLLPGCSVRLRGAEVVDVAAASGVDTCWYDLVTDDEFILGAVPGVPDVYTGVGWRGTGYKFAPWVGRVLAQLAVQRGTVYDIGRFAPARFAGGAPVTGVAS